MPAIQAGSKVLVSGANGFVAVWLIQTLLERGFSVRGTIRSASKGEHLKNLFAEKYGKKLELVIVEDITKEGAFDEAVKGVDAIAHTASPFNYAAIDAPEDTIKPAVDGTVGILQSALKNGNPTVKRIIILSSAVAVFEFGDKPRVFTEADWNVQAPALVQEKGREAGAFIIYFASKTLAEKSAWDFYNENKAAISWDLTTLNPPLVLGPVLHEVTHAADLGQSAGDWYNAVLTPDSNGMTNEQLATEPPGSWVDVRDLADAHVLALEKAEAGGERFIVTAGPYVHQDWLDVVNKVAPTVSELPVDRVLPKGVPGAGKVNPHFIVLDVSKAESILGVKYHSMEETATDTLKDALRRGW